MTGQLKWKKKKIWKASVFNTFPSTFSVGPAGSPGLAAYVGLGFFFFFFNQKISVTYIYNINTTDLENKDKKKKNVFALDFAHYILMLLQPGTDALMRIHLRG